MECLRHRSELLKRELVLNEYEFYLPFPPTNNNYYTIARNRKVLSKKGREYKSEAVNAIIEQRLNDKRISGSIGITLVLNPPCNRRRDLDNFEKPLLDAITESGLWGDDSQIDRKLTIRGVKSKVGHVIVNVKELV